MSPANPVDPSSDPFASIESQRTFMIPTPGVRATDAAAPTSAPVSDVVVDIGSVDTGLNPLVALANRLLAIVPQIHSTTQLADPGVLKESLAQALREFDASAASRGIAPERAMAARYILCTLLDEAAASTPWGGGGVWGRYSLLAMFHNETWGGEKVFQLMAKLAENPSANRDLLELIYAALCLGFQGRYRVIEGGNAQLEAVRERLAQILKKERGDFAQPLAEHWRGQAMKRRPLLSWLPLSCFRAACSPRRCPHSVCMSMTASTTPPARQATRSAPPTTSAGPACSACTPIPTTAGSTCEATSPRPAPPCPSALEHSSSRRDSRKPRARPSTDGTPRSALPTCMPTTA